jgi:hypothetical protein
MPGIISLPHQQRDRWVERVAKRMPYAQQVMATGLIKYLDERADAGCPLARVRDLAVGLPTEHVEAFHDLVDTMLKAGVLLRATINGDMAVMLADVTWRLGHDEKFRAAVLKVAGIDKPAPPPTS